MKESNRTFQEFEKRAWKPWILLHKKKIVVEQVILFRSQNVWDTTQVSLVFETIFFFPCFSCLSYQKTCILSSLHTQMTQYFNESDREMMKKEQEDDDMKESTKSRMSCWVKRDYYCTYAIQGSNRNESTAEGNVPIEVFRENQRTDLEKRTEFHCTFHL